jgi:hypothetical protein
MGNHQGLGGTSMNTQEHLNRIKAKCQELLAIAEKRTVGKWHIFEGDHKYPGIEADEVSIVIYGLKNDGAGVRTGLNDATFIASCAGAAEAGWRATVAAIDLLEDAADIGTGHYTPLAVEAAQKIIAAWPQELL